MGKNCAMKQISPSVHLGVLSTFHEMTVGMLFGLASHASFLAPFRELCSMPSMLTDA